ncbi:hypothetical protein C1645_831817 [Glomus cerebriforme]|uniref:Uncharacterized protein n=1 Tax=Glomus cerebriforme TaxID=658196 RepID=A0A397SEQ6_9GLOM|nr:hypothetical protein C1645_831817 [Glomus cerebriforme]
MVLNSHFEGLEIEIKLKDFLFEGLCFGFELDFEGSSGQYFEAKAAGSEGGNNIIVGLIELVISNQGQELTSNSNNYNNQHGKTQNVENNSIETEIIQQEMTQNLGQYSSNSNNNSSSF